METNLYSTTIPPMMKSIEALMKVLDKAVPLIQSRATERRPFAYFEAALLNDRLIFDQFAFVMQVQRVSDNAKGGAARLAGVEPPAMEDGEKTIEELKLRLQKTLEFLRSIGSEHVVGQEERRVTLPYWKAKYMTASEYATEYLMPNFYFHYVTAYQVLRKNGLDIGKNDYIGGLPLKDL